MTPRLVEAVMVTAELTGTTYSPEAARVLLADLQGYPEDALIGALKRCRRELKGRLNVAEIVSRLEDGRPTPEEAWAMVPVTEDRSAVWTPEMREAWAVAYPLIREESLIPARMAFLERYRVLVQQARDRREPVRWEFTPGTDKDGRELVILDAVQKNRLTLEGAQALLPYHRQDEGLNARLLGLTGKAAQALLAPPKPTDASRKAIAHMREKLKDKAA